MRLGIKLPAILLAVVLYAITLMAGWVGNQVKITQADPIEEVIETVVTQVNREHLRCLAYNIYFEAANEPLLGQIAVARVVMNRIEHGFGKNPCGVVYQAAIVETEEVSKKLCQFSWVCEGKLVPNTNSAAYQQALNIAHRVLSEDAWSDIIPNNILFFHNTSVKPDWKYNPVLRIGNHIFYSRERKHK